MTRTFKYTVNPERLVTRRVPITWSSAQEREAALTALAELPFVQSVSCAQDAAEVSIEYDAGQEDIEGIEALLTERGAHLLGGWRRRLVDAWHQFQDHSRVPPDAEELDHPHTAAHAPPGRPNRQHRP
jgi:hypothetical protein